MLLTCGCSDSGPGLAEVKGRVTLDGQPVAGAMVTFEPQVTTVDGGANSIGITDDNGEYTLQYPGDKVGAVVATHKVTIAYEEGSQGQKPIPAKYNSNSELTREVQAGENEINLELESK